MFFRIPSLKHRQTNEHQRGSGHSRIDGGFRLPGGKSNKTNVVWSIQVDLKRSAGQSDFP